MHAKSPTESVLIVAAAAETSASGKSRAIFATDATKDAGKSSGLDRGLSRRISLLHGELISSRQ